MCLFCAFFPFPYMPNFRSTCMHFWKEYCFFLFPEMKINEFCENTVKAGRVCISSVFKQNVSGVLLIYASCWPRLAERPTNTCIVFGA